MRKHNANPDQPVTLVATRPTADQYMHLRGQAGWDAVDARAAEAGLSSSLYNLVAVDNNRVVACARIVGDGGLYFYIQDMLVDQEYRGRGIGTQMMQHLLKWLDSHAAEGAFIGLMAARNAASFYARFGFRPRDDDGPGMFLPTAELQSGSEISPVI